MMANRFFARRNPYREIGHRKAISKTEYEYGLHLRHLLETGVIKWFRPQPFNIRIGAIGGKSAYWKPDYLVLTKDDFLEIHEVKGYTEQHSLVRIKAAADALPIIRFRIIKKARKKDGGGWLYEEIS